MNIIKVVENEETEGILTWIQAVSFVFLNIQLKYFLSTRTGH